MAHPKTIGDRSTLATMLALHEAGYAVFLPFGENTRSDLVIDDGAGLLRVQCKTGRLRAGAVRFSTCSSYAHHSHPRTHRRDYLGQVDRFAVYCPDTGSVYLVPMKISRRRLRARSGSSPLETDSSAASDWESPTRLRE